MTCGLTAKRPGSARIEYGTTFAFTFTKSLLINCLPKFPSFTLNDMPVKFASEFKYMGKLGHIINNKLIDYDDNDVRRMCMRSK